MCERERESVCVCERERESVCVKEREAPFTRTANPDWLCYVNSLF